MKILEYTFLSLILVARGNAFTLYGTTRTNRNLQSSSLNRRFLSSDGINDDDEVLVEENSAFEEGKAVSISSPDDTKEKDETETIMSDELVEEETLHRQPHHLLQKLLMTASCTDRGQFASKEQKQSMSELISELESIYMSNISPTLPSPAASKEIQGTWELVYSDTQLFRSSPFFMAGRAVCQTEEEAQRYDWFCDMHRAALAISEIGKVRQIISSDRLISEFEVTVGSIPFLSDFTPLKYSGGLPFTINGAIVSSADISSTQQGTQGIGSWTRLKSKDPIFLCYVQSWMIKEWLLNHVDWGHSWKKNVSGYKNPRPYF
jgi:PAP_fibrillin.